MQDLVCRLPRIYQPVEKRHAGIVRRWRSELRGRFSGGCRAATIAVFLGPLQPKVTSRFTFSPTAIMSASAFTFSNRLNLKRLIPYHYLASPNKGSTHTPRLPNTFS